MTTSMRELKEEEEGMGTPSKWDRQKE